MKSIHIRQVDEATLAGLKRRARRHRRSLQKEIEVLLADAAAMAPADEAESRESRLSLRTVSTGRADGSWSRSEIYADDGR